jgi:IS30 family transposase
LSTLEVINTYYTANDLAGLFQVHVETIRREIKRGKLKCFYVGNEPKFTQQQVDDYTGVLNYGKTSRELQLEKELEELREQLREKDSFIQSIQIGLLKLNCNA